ncbi:MAG: c-type cytochrome [Myxococcaceae bacterium]
MKKLLLIVGAVVAVLVVGAVVFVSSKPDHRAASSETFEATPERLARGKYLVENITNCLHCHSEMNLEKFGTPPVPGTEGKGGGFCLDASMGFPGKVCASNISSDKETGIGAWTDGEIARAIREGVSRDGTPLFPVMPYPFYRNMSDEDVKSIVVFLRTLPPIHHKVAPRELEPPLNVLVRFMPKPLEGPVAEQDLTDLKVRGRYLVEMGACGDCHTPKDDKGNPLPGRELSGGQEFKMPWGTFRTANLTPHATGLGQWNKETFIARFKAYANPEVRDAKVDPKNNTIMGWYAYARLTDEDLGAIYDHLRSLPPVDNAVNRVAAPAVP